VAICWAMESWGDSNAVGVVGSGVSTPLIYSRYQILFTGPQSPETPKIVHSGRNALHGMVSPGFDQFGQSEQFLGVPRLWGPVIRDQRRVSLLYIKGVETP
jgi:hypothetical protein